MKLLLHPELGPRLERDAAAAAAVAAVAAAAAVVAAAAAAQADEAFAPHYRR